jgi:nucleoside-diphosphate-sugar epimerase
MRAPTCCPSRPSSSTPATEMRALVTGGAGFLGQHVVGLARARGWEVSAPDRGALNLRDPAAVARAVGELRPQLILHLAAMTSPAQAEADPQGAQADNVAAVAALLAAPGDARLVLVSTCHVYGILPPTPVSEATPPAPSGVYARTKAAGEALGLAASSGGARRGDRPTLPPHRPWAPPALRARGLGRPGAGRGDDPAHGPPGPHPGLPRRARRRRGPADRGHDRGARGRSTTSAAAWACPCAALAEHIAQGRPIVEEPSRGPRRGGARLVGDPKKLGALGWAPRIPLAQSLAELVARG